MKVITALLMVFATCVGISPTPAGALAPKQRLIEEVVPLTLVQLQYKAKVIAKRKVKEQGWNNKEWLALEELWYRESRWNPHSKNRRSSAYGIPQLLKLPIGTPMETQISRGIKYIIHRYKKPSRALAFHNRHNWY